MRAFQVKTTTTRKPHYRFDRDDLPVLYHALAIVRLEGEGRELHLDGSSIYVLFKEEVTKSYYRFDELASHVISQELVEMIFSEEPRVAVGTR